jgi:prepilin peptidase CpaA
MEFGFEHLSTAALIAFVASVALVDLRTHRIPNLLCLAGAIAGMALQSFSQGADGALAGLGGAGVGLCMFLPFYALRAFGAGDVKAMAAVGAFLGPEQALVAVAATLMAGSVLGIGVLLRIAASPASAFYRVFAVIGAPFSIARGAERSASAGQERFPYGAAIAAGAIVTLFWSGRF